MNNAGTMKDDSHPERHKSSPARAARLRASTFAFVLLLAAIVCSAVGMSNSVGQQWSDISKVAAVALFVGAMVALAMGMIGDTHSSE